MGSCCYLVQDALGVRSLPTLIWVSPRGEILTRRGVSAILRDGEGAQFPWKEKPVRDIDEALEIVAEEPVVLAFLDLADEETQRETLKVKHALSTSHMHKGQTAKGSVHLTLVVIIAVVAVVVQDRASGFASRIRVFEIHTFDFSICCR